MKCTALLALLLATPACAETMTYHYDALGRLVESFSDTTHYRNDYILDPADNRSQLISHMTVFTLQKGQSILSSDQRFKLAMQGDGNLVWYGPSGVLWNAHTEGTGATYASMQSDGNLVVYDASNTSVWASATNKNPGAWLDLQNDGNLVIYDGNRKAIWSTGTGGQ